MKGYGRFRRPAHSSSLDSIIKRRTSWGRKRGGILSTQISQKEADSPDSAYRYSAFLSYRTGDVAIARWLHRKIEQYRVPRALVGKPGAHGPIPLRVGPVFRDRDDARTAEDIETIIAQELSKAKQLIVLCSPLAVAPESWVPREIVIFRARRPDGPIHAVIADGEPPSCFPQPLLTPTPDGPPHTPLAADLRPRRRGGNDGRSRAVIKIIAGLIGAQFDDLWRRERRRRLRNAFVYSTVLVVLVLLIVSGFKYTNDISASRRLAANAVNLIDGQYDLALLLAAEAYRTSPTDEAEDALFRTVLARPYLRHFISDSGSQVATDSAGTLLAVGDGRGDASLYDLHSAKLIRKLPGSGANAVRALRFSRDGSRLAVLEDSDRLTVFETSNGTILSRLEPGFSGFFKLAFDYDSSNSFGTAHSTSGFPAAAAPLALTGDGSRIAFVDKMGYLAIADIGSAEVTKRLGEPRKEDDRPGALAFDVAGTTLAVATASTIEVWSSLGSLPERVFTSGAIRAADVVITDSPALVVALTDDGKLQGFDIASGKKVFAFQAHDSHGTSYGIGDLGTRLVWSYSAHILISATSTGEIAAWPLAKILHCSETPDSNCESRLRFSRVEGGHLSSLAASSDGQVVFSASYEGTVEQYSLNANDDLFSPIHGLAGARLFTVADQAGTVAFADSRRVLITDPMGLSREIPIPSPCADDTLIDLSLSPNAKWLLTAGRQMVCLSDLTSSAPYTERVLKVPSDKYQFRPKFFFNGSSDRLVGRYEGVNRAESASDDVGTVVWNLLEPQAAAHTLSGLGAVGFSDSNTLASETESGSVVRTDLRTDVPINTGGEQLAAGPDQWTFSSRSQTLYTAANPGIIVKTDLQAARSEQLFDSANRPAGEYLVPAVSPDGERVAIGNSRGTISLWTSGGRRVGGVFTYGDNTSEIQHLAFASGGTALFVQWRDGPIYELTLTPAYWLRLAEARAGRTLTAEERGRYAKSSLTFQRAAPNPTEHPKSASGSKTPFDACFIRHPQASPLSDDQMFVPLACSPTLQKISSAILALPAQSDAQDAQLCRLYGQAIDELPLLLSGMQTEWAVRAVNRRDVRIREAMVLLGISGLVSELATLQAISPGDLGQDELGVRQWAMRFLAREGRNVSADALTRKQGALSRGDLLAWPRCALQYSTLLSASAQSSSAWPALRQASFPQEDLSGVFYQVTATKGHGEEFATAANVLMEEKSYDAARRVVAEALNVEPLNTFSLNIAGLIELRTNNCEAALPFFDKSRMAGRSDGWPQFNSALCLERLGRLSDAEAMYGAATAKDIKPRNDTERAQFLNGYAWFLVSHFASDQEKMREAEADATEAVKVTGEQDSNDIDTLAAVKYAMGDHAAAIDLETKAIEVGRRENNDTAGLEETLRRYKATTP